MENVSFMYNFLEMLFVYVSYLRICHTALVK